jgi:hypothetical protein
MAQAADWRSIEFMPSRATPMVRLSREPDGYGFIYVKVWDEQGAIHEVNILPPKSEWRGQTMLKGFEPHSSDWILYLDGEEVARVRDGAELERTVFGYLPSARDQR